MSEETKKCPFCAETIQAAAVKCRYCGEWFVARPNTAPAAAAHAPFAAARAPGAAGKWHQSTGIIVLALLTLGPLALPMVWAHPRYSVTNKIIVTVGVIVLTVGLCYLMVLSYRNLMDQIKALGL